MAQLKSAKAPSYRPHGPECVAAVGDGPVEVRVEFDGAVVVGQVCASQVRVGELRVGEVCGRKLGVGEVRIGEVRAAEVRIDKVAAVKVAVERSAPFRFAPVKVARAGNASCKSAPGSGPYIGVDAGERRRPWLA
jgi:hypothetical protein